MLQVLLNILRKLKLPPIGKPTFLAKRAKNSPHPSDGYKLETRHKERMTRMDIQSLSL